MDSYFKQTFITDVNIDLLKKEVYEIAEKVKREKLKSLSTHTQRRMFGKGSITTKLWQHYNLFNFDKPELNNLLIKIKKFFIDTYLPTETYYISAWVNIHKNGEHLNLHSHWEPEYQTYHGYYAVNAEPSNTTYILPTNKKIYKHENKNFCLLINKSEGDKHMVSVWHEDSDRITIAFDIVPYSINKQIIDSLDCSNQYKLFIE